MTRKSRVKVWKPPLVIVYWLDAVNYNEMEGTRGDILERAKLARQETSGFLVRYDDELTVLAHDYAPPEKLEEQPRIGNITVISSGWVKEVRQGKRLIAMDKNRGEQVGSPTGLLGSLPERSRTLDERPDGATVYSAADERRDRSSEPAPRPNISYKEGETKSGATG